jgi:hypothetical protein
MSPYEYMTFILKSTEVQLMTPLIFAEFKVTLCAIIGRDWDV